MKLHRKLLAGLALVAGFASTLAAQTVTTATGDLVMGFRVVGNGFGSAYNLEVNLGTYSSLNTRFNSSGTNLVVADLSADLTSVYGADWNTRTDLVWGIAGNNASPSLRQVYLSKAEVIDGMQSSPYTTASNATLNSAAAATGNAVNGLNGQTALTFTSAARVDAGITQSWTNALAPSGSALAFGFVNKSEFENGTEIGNGTFAISDLYMLNNNAITYKGSFALDSNGVVTYGISPTAFGSAIPEPSTYAAIAGAVFLGFAISRRRLKKA